MKYTVLGLLVILSGCTQRGFYETVQDNHVRECERLEGRQREECIAQHDMSHTEYENLRKSVERSD